LIHSLTRRLTSVAVVGISLLPIVVLAQAQPQTTPEPDPPIEAMIYTLPETPLGALQNSVLENSIENDRGFLLGGIGSDLWHGASDPADEFWMITDRGPNGQIEVDTSNRRTFPLPSFTPTILHVKLADGSIQVLETLPILTPDGEPVTGLSNLDGYDETPYDYTAETVLDFNQNGLDSEGLVRTSDGEFWVADEYSPSILRVDSSGTVITRYVPEGLVYDATAYPVVEVLPDIYSLRKINRGFEGIALSTDESTLYIVLQSPLLNPDRDTGNASRNTRVLAFDIASESVTGEYVYQFDGPASYEAVGEPDEMKLSGVVAISPTELLILERTDAVAKLYRVDISRATNILDSKWNDPSTTPTLESLNYLPGSQVYPLPKNLVIDVSRVIGVPSKIEGVAVLNPSTIVNANDNDFDIGDFDADGNNQGEGKTSQVLVIQLATPLS
jgi:hypothetical protein